MEIKLELKYCSKIKLILFLLFICTQSIFAYDSIEILNPAITLNKSGYYVSNEALSANEAYNKFVNGQFTPLPKEAKSFGFDPRTYWYAFDVMTNTEKHFVLDLKSPVDENVTLFIYQDAKLFKKEVSGYLIPIIERPIKDFSVRFEVLDSDKSTTYLLKVDSQNPRYSAFAIGSIYEVSENWNWRHLIFTLCLGGFVVLVLYNLFLLFALKDILYFYYILYVGGLCILNIYALGYGAFLPSSTPYTAIIIAVSLQIEIVGLTLFTNKFLDLDKRYPKLKRNLIILMYINILAALFVPIAHGLQELCILALFALFFSLIYVGIKSLLDGYRPTVYYLLATGIGLLGICFFMFTHQGATTLTTFSLSSSMIAMIWDMVFLSFALAYRIKLLQEDKAKAQSIIVQKAKFAAIGETIGNIAHQWRQPLNEIAAVCVNIETEIKFKGAISNEKLLERISILDTILTRLSKTIDTFQNFFNNYAVGNFNLTSCINAALQFTQADMERNAIHISIEMECGDIEICGNEDEFFEALVVILNNAKDAIISNNSQNSYIKLTVNATKEQVVINVQDSGGGIKADNFSKIFEPYYSTKDLNGMGIGLYTAKTIIESKMNGSITATNANDGAVFTLRLPLKICNIKSKN
ncbi:MAG: hypothetical protein RL154_821 [Pseudomonadota bacterium]